MARAKAIEGETYTYTVVFEPDEEAGGYTVTYPALPGLVTEGDTLEEARAMAAGRHPLLPGEPAQRRRADPAQRGIRDRTDPRIRHGRARAFIKRRMATPAAGRRTASALPTRDACRVRAQSSIDLCSVPEQHLRFGEATSPWYELAQEKE